MKATDRAKERLKKAFGDRVLQVRNAEGGRITRAYFWKDYQSATGAEIDNWDSEGRPIWLIEPKDFAQGWVRIAPYDGRAAEDIAEELC